MYGLPHVLLTAPHFIMQDMLALHFRIDCAFIVSCSHFHLQLLGLHCGTNPMELTSCRGSHAAICWCIATG